jgi:hypothetical protein
MEKICGHIIKSSKHMKTQSTDYITIDSIRSSCPIKNLG